MPKKLSDFGFFLNMQLQIPQDGVLPYDLVNPLFTDYTDKLRFLYIPAGGKAEYKENHVFDFPNGTALIKTFAYLNNTGESELEEQLLETRLLIKKGNAWRNISYVWNEEQSDAFLNIAGKTINTSFVNDKGDIREVRYRVPNINQCKECHQSGNEIKPIGPKARNLNHDYNYENISMNQLARWADEGWIDSQISYNTMPDWSDVSIDIDSRARAYLDINCGHCHITGGSADTTGLYLNFTEDRSEHLGIYKKPVAAGRASNNFKYSIKPGAPEESIMPYRMQSRDPGIMMPESGRFLNHDEGVALINKWIKSM
jgi:uncharacterized repeat protein (TIGR03806 family)